jgi:hypothetical protein
MTMESAVRHDPNTLNKCFFDLSFVQAHRMHAGRRFDLERDGNLVKGSQAHTLTHTHPKSNEIECWQSTVIKFFGKVKNEAREQARQCNEPLRKHD